MPTFTDHFLFEIQGLGSDLLRVARLHGTEGVSDLFHFDLTVVSEDPAVAFAGAIGKPALLTLLGDGEPRYVHGMVARFEQGDAGKKLTAYRVTIVPKAWRLLHRRDCRIFQNLTAPDIIKQVLEGAGLASGDDFAFHLRGSYVSREYCVQWRESDWAYVCRLLEDEGIFFYFEHHEDKHVLVFADDAGAHAPIGGASTIAYRPSLGALIEEEHVRRFHVSEEARTGKIEVRDYNYLKPDLRLEGDASGSNEADLPIYDWMGADVEHTPAGRATTRLDERVALRRVASGESACERLVPGFTFTLQDHPREDFNAAYILTRVEHEGIEPTLTDGGGGDTRYESRFSCVPSAVTLRPAHVTPRPTIRGVQTAMVVGPPGEEIYTDEHGRVRVQFPWDRLGKRDDKSSCWIRVGQTWAGPGWGALFIPRIGHEVLVDFIDGNPDRPVIVGSVYHGTNKPPYALPGEKTKSTIKSNTSPGGGGWNELRFEDKAGSEEVYVRAQKDMLTEVLNDAKRTVGHDDVLDVTNDRTVHVGRDRSTTIDRDDTLHVQRKRTVTVDGDEEVTVTKTETVHVGDDTTVALGKNVSLSIAKNVTSAISGDAASTIDGKMDATVGGDQTIEVSGAAALKVGSDHQEEAGLARTIKAGDKVVIECGAAKVTIEKNGNITIEGANLSVKTDTKIELKASAQVNVEASGTLNIKASGPAKIESSAPVAVKGAVVNVN
ncbi:MAG: type VI secretion system tip protein TssI/VgrG [Minicystis sp.]